SGDGWVQRGTIAGVTFAAGQRLGARALADGTVQVFRDATLLGTVSVAGWTYAASGGRIGLSFTNAAGGRWDDFGGGDMNLGLGAIPIVHVTSPNGGEAWAGGSEHAIQWTATDDIAVTTVDVFYRDGAASAWTPLSLGQSNNGSFSWSVHDTPTPSAKVRVVAHDGSGNAGVDSSNTIFNIL